MIEIEQATSIHIEAVGRLFDLYRRFYECDPDLDLATSYIRERIERGEHGRENRYESPEENKGGTNHANCAFAQERHGLGKADD